MATRTPDEGLEWYADRSINSDNAENERIYDVAVGSGTAGLSDADTQLDQEEYRATVDDSSVAMIDTAGDPGEIELRITVSGGTEVPAGTTVTELGAWARDPSIADGSVTESDDKMVYREVRAGITLQSGDRKTFSFTISITNS